MQVEQPRRPDPSQFSVQAILDVQNQILGQIERHVRVIKGWVIFFGICAVASVGLTLLAAGAVGS